MSDFSDRLRQQIKDLDATRDAEQQEVKALNVSKEQTRRMAEELNQVAFDVFKEANKILGWEQARTSFKNDEWACEITEVHGDQIRSRIRFSAAVVEDIITARVQLKPPSMGKSEAAYSQNCVIPGLQHGTDLKEWIETEVANCVTTWHGKFKRRS